jgi:hypothetical protein
MVMLLACAVLMAGSLAAASPAAAESADADLVFFLLAAL